ncbi:1780_t:CDS:2, partial [Funneliformis caledonium]
DDNGRSRSRYDSRSRSRCDNRRNNRKSRSWMRKNKMIATKKSIPKQLEISQQRERRSKSRKNHFNQGQNKSNRSSSSSRLHSPNSSYLFYEDMNKDLRNALRNEIIRIMNRLPENKKLDVNKTFKSQRES